MVLKDYFAYKIDSISTRVCAFILLLIIACAVSLLVYIEANKINLLANARHSNFIDVYPVEFSVSVVDLSEGNIVFNFISNLDEGTDSVKVQVSEKPREDSLITEPVSELVSQYKPKFKLTSRTLDPLRLVEFYSEDSVALTPAGLSYWLPPGFLPAQSSLARQNIEAEKHFLFFENLLKGRRGTPDINVSVSALDVLRSLTEGGSEKFWCVNIAPAFVIFLGRVGIPSRVVQSYRYFDNTGIVIYAGGHTFPEVFDYRQKKWFVSDPTLGVYQFRAPGISALNIEDIFVFLSNPSLENKIQLLKIMERRLTWVNWEDVSSVEREAIKKYYNRTNQFFYHLGRSQIFTKKSALEKIKSRFSLQPEQLVVNANAKLAWSFFHLRFLYWFLFVVIVVTISGVGVSRFLALGKRFTRRRTDLR